MKDSRKSTGLRALLDTCDDLQQIRSKLADPEVERDARTRLRRQAKRKTEQLARKLETCQLRGPLGQVMKSFPLTPDHFQVLTVLLHRQMRCEDPALEGRLILSSIFGSSYEALSRIDLLHPNGALRAAGLLALEDEEGYLDQPLEARFSLSDQGLACFCQEVAGLPADPLGQHADQRAPYASNGELLVDLRLLHNLYQLRSTRVFAAGQWNRLNSSSHHPGRGLNERIRASWERVRDRLGATPGSSSFPTVSLMREYDLREDEMVCVIHLLFKELYEGNAYADVADLIRLISDTEAELILNRRVLMEHSRLLQRELVSIEPFLEGRTLTGEAHLNDWVVNYLLGPGAATQDIKADERIDWHMYLAQLNDTQRFFLDLDAN